MFCKEFDGKTRRSHSTPCACVCAWLETCKHTTSLGMQHLSRDMCWSPFQAPAIVLDEGAIVCITEAFYHSDDSFCTILQNKKKRWKLQDNNRTDPIQVELDTHTQYNQIDALALVVTGGMMPPNVPISVCTQPGCTATKMQVDPCCSNHTMAREKRELSKWK